MWIYVLGPLIAAPLAALFNYLVQYFLSNTSKNENPITEDLRED